MSLTLPRPTGPWCRRGLSALAAPLRALGPATRVSLGLVSLMLMALMLSDVLLRGFLPDPLDTARKERRMALQVLSTEVAAHLQVHGGAGLAQVLDAARLREPGLRSVALVVRDGPVWHSGPHDGLWQLAPGAPSTSEQLLSSLRVEGKVWGELQMRYDPPVPHTLMGLLKQPLLQGTALMVVLGFVGFQLYLRRAMVYLDPSRVVPDRVRGALDTLTEAVVVLDERQQVLLVNRSFQAWLPPEVQAVGHPITQLAWLALPAADLPGGAPWAEVLQQGVPRLGERLALQVGGQRRHLILNCSPILEEGGGGAARGCLLSLSDVTELEERTARLHQAMGELEASREEIRRKNEELLLLATRDPLTGCLNRRAFASESQVLLENARREGWSVSCVMGDIDHFKRINDTHGHAGGDVVLQSAAKTLGRVLRAGDLLARFGGEEFCMLVVDADPQQALVAAERLRAAIEAETGRALRNVQGLRVTMSFGVAPVDLSAVDLDAVIDQADQALYQSKQNGRNRVTRYQPTPV